MAGFWLARGIPAAAVLLPLGLVLAACSSSPSLIPRGAPSRPAHCASRQGSAGGTSGCRPRATKLFLLTQHVQGELKVPPASIRCSRGDSVVTVSGTLGGVPFTLRLSHLHPGQTLTFPPPAAGFSDQVSWDLGGPSPATYLAGYRDGTVQGIGSLSVSANGRSGQLNLNVPYPVGASPQNSYVNGVLNEDVNSSSLKGSWACPE